MFRHEGEPKRRATRTVAALSAVALLAGGTGCGLRGNEQNPQGGDSVTYSLNPETPTSIRIQREDGKPLPGTMTEGLTIDEANALLVGINQAPGAFPCVTTGMIASIEDPHREGQIGQAEVQVFDSRCIMGIDSMTVTTVHQQEAVSAQSRVRTVTIPLRA